MPGSQPRPGHDDMTAISRADFLRRSTVALGAAALLARTPDALAGGRAKKTSSPSPAPAPSLLTTKVNGVNLVPTPLDPGYDGTWSTLFTYWPWSQSLAPQLQLCHGIGANGARLIGGVGAIADGTLTTAQYVSQYEQFVAYCQSLGMYVQAVGCAFGHQGDATQAQVIGYLSELLAMLASYPNVVAFDISSEIFGQGYSVGMTDSEVVAYAAALYTALKPLSRIPMGFSHSYPFTDYRVALLAPYCDYLDFHVYTTSVPNGSSPASLLATYPAKPLLFGEWGDPVADTTANRNAQAEYVLSLVTGQAACAGAFYWAAVDQTNPLGSGWDNFGLFETVTSPMRATVGDIFERFPT